MHSSLYCERKLAWSAPQFAGRSVMGPLLEQRPYHQFQHCTTCIKSKYGETLLDVTWTKTMQYREGQLPGQLFTIRFSLHAMIVFVCTARSILNSQGFIPEGMKAGPTCWHCLWEALCPVGATISPLRNPSRVCMATFLEAWHTACSEPRWRPAW